jgi:hypothetical protein
MPSKSYYTSDFTRFIVTGFYAYTEKKFRRVYTSWFMANGINLWRGHVYGELKNGKRVLLKTVNN